MTTRHACPDCREQGSTEAGVRPGCLCPYHDYANAECGCTCPHLREECETCGGAGYLEETS